MLDVLNNNLHSSVRGASKGSVNQTVIFVIKAITVENNFHGLFLNILFGSFVL